MTTSKPPKDQQPGPNLLDDPRGRKGVAIGLAALAAASFFGLPPLVALIQTWTRTTAVTDPRWQQAGALRAKSFWATPAAVAYGDEKWVAVGSVGFDPSFPRAWISTNGRRWHLVRIPIGTSGATSATITSVVFAHGTWTAVGSATAFGNLNAAVWSSPDGRTWQLVSATSRSLAGPGTQAMNAVLATAHGYIAAGYEDFGGDANPAFWTSTNGISWQRVGDSGTQLEELGDQAVTALARTNGGLFVAGGFDRHASQSDAAIWTSRNGRSWARDRNAPDLGGPRNDVIYALAATKQTIVAVGSTALGSDVNAESWASSDGTHWTRASDDPAVLGGDAEQSMRAIVAVDGAFVGVGTDAAPGIYDPAAWSSTNGETWVRTQSPTFNKPRRSLILAAAVNASEIMAVGSYDNGVGQNGLAWSRRR